MLPKFTINIQPQVQRADTEADAGACEGKLRQATIISKVKSKSGTFPQFNLQPSC